MTGVCRACLHAVHRSSNSVHLVGAALMAGWHTSCGQHHERCASFAMPVRLIMNIYLITAAACWVRPLVQWLNA